MPPNCPYAIDVILWGSKKERIIVTTMVMVKPQEKATV